MHTGFGWGELRERDHLDNIYIDQRIILNLICKKCNGKEWTGFLWHRIDTGGRGL